MEKCQDCKAQASLCSSSWNLKGHLSHAYVLCWIKTYMYEVCVPPLIPWMYFLTLSWKFLQFPLLLSQSPLHVPSDPMPPTFPRLYACLLCVSACPCKVGAGCGWVQQMCCAQGCGRRGGSHFRLSPCPQNTTSCACKTQEPYWAVSPVNGWTLEVHCA